MRTCNRPTCTTDEPRVCTCACAHSEHNRFGCRTWFGDKNTGFRCDCEWNGSSRPLVTLTVGPRSVTLCEHCATVWRANQRVAEEEAMRAFLAPAPAPVDLRAIADSIASP